MFNPRYLKIMLFALLFSSLSACSTTSGDYGPFTLVIESQDGKKVEDIIVTLTYGGSGGHSKYSSYRETQVVSTGEKITFPRGYITGTQDSAFGMYLSINHPDYSEWPTRGITIYTKDKNTEIDLDKSMIRFNSISEKEIEERVSRGKFTKNKGRVIVEPMTKAEAVISIKRSSIYMKVNSYFVRAIRIGRSDLVDKHISLKLAEIYSGDVNSEEALQFEKKLRDSIDYFMEYNQ